MEQQPADQELPAWLVEARPYDPPRDRDGFVRRNLLKLASTPARLSSVSGERFALARALEGVGAALRLLGLLVGVACTSAATNMAFVWLVFAYVLVTLALRPVGQLRIITSVACVAALVAALITMPAALMHMAPPSLVVRMGVKTFCTVGLTLSLAQDVPWSRVAAALVAAHVSAHVVFVIDAAVRGVVVLGRMASHLSESLALRSVGHNRHKTGSAAGVMGMTFVRASVFAAEQADAMACRGYDGVPTATPERPSAAASALYVLAVALLVALFFWLERAMRGV